MFRIKNDLDYDDFCDLYTLTHRGRPTPSNLLSYVLSLSLLFFSIWFLIFNTGSWFSVIFLGCIVLIVHDLLTRKKRTAKRMFKYKAQMEDLNAELSADEEGIRAEGEKLHRFYSFLWITDIIHGNGFYLLKGKGGQNLIMAEHCFIEGEPRNFGTFLQEKTGLTVREYR